MRKVRLFKTVSIHAYSISTVAKTFKSESQVSSYVLAILLPLLNLVQCVVANVDADDKKNSKLAQKYGITGFPTIKFFSKDKKDEPEDYDGGRTEEEFVAFLNEKCGTKRAVGGGLNDEVRVFHNLFHF